MKIERRTGKDVRLILIGMITNETVLGKIATRWDGKMFSSRWANLIGSWCVKYFDRYGEPPKGAIEGLLETWSSQNDDEKTVSIIEKLLGQIRGDYDAAGEEVNPQYVIDLAAEHFNKVKLRRLAQGIEAKLDSGELDEANKLVDNFHRVEMGVGSVVDVLNDHDAIREAFENESDVLVKYPGDLGKFFGKYLERDGFVAFMGPEKRGKSWWLQDVAFRALFQRRRVALFQVGDMSQNQVMRRLMIRIAKRPKQPGTIRYPVRIEKPEGDQQFASVEHELKRFDEPLTWRQAYKAAQRVLKEKVKGNGDYLRLSCHPTMSLTVAGMRDILRSWERDGWVPDVIVIDYADILAPPSSSLDVREAINRTWGQLRSLSEALHCLIVTATQTDSASYQANIIRRSNFSEDKRKLAHVTGMIGLNCSEVEKQLGLIRLNWVALRDGEYYESACVHVAGCLPIGNPAVRSVM